MNRENLESHSSDVQGQLRPVVAEDSEVFATVVAKLCSQPPNPASRLSRTEIPEMISTLILE